MFILFIEFAASILEGYIGIRFAGLLFENKFKKSKAIIITFISSFFLAIIVTILNMVKLFSCITIIFGIFSISIIVFLIYNCKIPHAFLITCFYFICLNYLDFFAITIASFLLQDSNYPKIVTTYYSYLRIKQLFICKLLLIIFYYNIKRFFKKKFHISSFNHYVILSLICGIGTIYLINSSFAKIYPSNFKDWLIFSIIFILAWLLLFFYEQFKYEKKEENFLHSRNSLLEKNFKELNLLYSANAQAYHDFNNHINILQHLLIKKDTSTALNYLNSINQPTKCLLSHTWTGNDIIDIILNNKLKIMDDNCIDYKINVEFPNNSNLQPNDICSILANLLDNAIEACNRNLKKSNKWINITIRIINAMLIFKIENGNEIEPKIQNMHFITSKKEKQFHGWGLKCVENVITKYQGNMTYAIKQNSFQIIILLNYDIKNS